MQAQTVKVSRPWETRTVPIDIASPYLSHCKHRGFVDVCALGSPQSDYLERKSIHFDFIKRIGGIETVSLGLATWLSR